MKKALAALCFLIALLFVSPVKATEWYASATGTPLGNGTLSNPWDLQTAINETAVIQPGDKIWLIGGTYKAPTSNGFSSTLNGTQLAPIVIRNYQGQLVTIDGAGTENQLFMQGQWTTAWGLHFTDSNAVNRTLTTVLPAGTYPSATCPISNGVQLAGPGNSLINNVQENGCTGLFGYASSPNAVIYGNLSYYNGYVYSPNIPSPCPSSDNCSSGQQNLGHGLYMQNNQGTKLIQDNIVGDNADNGLQIYGSTGSLVGFTTDHNTIYDNESWPFAHYQYQIVFGATGAVAGDSFTFNRTFCMPSLSNDGSVSIGQFDPMQAVTITGNYFAGCGITLAVDGIDAATVTGNTIVNFPQGTYPSLATGYPEQLVQFCQYTTQKNTDSTWDNNTYWGGLNLFYFGQYAYNTTTGNSGCLNGSIQAFTTWQGETGFDTHSTFNKGTPPNFIEVRPNLYETGRANIVVYNWQNLTAVSVDLSAVFTVGQPFEIRDVQNFFGPKTLTGTYQGGAISIPMTAVAGKEVVLGVSNCPSATCAVNTQPLFGAFVACSPACGNGGATPPPPPPARVILVTTATIPAGVVTTSYATTLAAAGGTLPYTWTVTGLPSGFTATGPAISGSPTTSGSYVLTVTVTDSSTPVNTTSVFETLTINAAPPPPPAATFTVGEVIATTTSISVRPSNAIPLVTPTGTEAVGAVGTIVGGPTPDISDILWQVQFSDQTGWVWQSDLAASGTTPPPPTCTAPSTLVNGVCTAPVPTCVSPDTLVNGVCTPPAPPVCTAPNTLVNGVCTAPAPPVCVSPNTLVNGVCTPPVTVTPTAPTLTSLTVTLTSSGALVSDIETFSDGSTADVTTLTKVAQQASAPPVCVSPSTLVNGVCTAPVTPPAPTSGPLTIPNNPSGTSVPNATVGTAYSYQLPVSGGAQPYTCILEQFGVGGPLPAGLSLSGCVISGTPTTAAPYAPFYIAVTDASGASLQPVLFIIKAQ